MSNEQTSTRVSVTQYSNGGVKVDYAWGATYTSTEEGCECADDYVPPGSLEAVYSSMKEAAKDVADFLTGAGEWA